MLVRRLGIVDYETVWRAMQAFTDRRTPETSDELWIVQHPPVFTLGQAGRREHVLAPGDIPVLQVDRGGQVTYHGPGQIVAYPLLDIRRLGITVKQLVEAIEEAVIRVVQDYGVTAGRVTGAPGVYVDGEKIAALGLRVRRGRSFHGLAFNIDMDLEPYRRINPCGFEGLRVTQLADLADVTLPEVEDRLVAAMAGLIGYPGRVRDADGELPDGLSAEA
ncbi:MAG: lipoyl(octanoyl) transferase LipB [Xanthomonadales bacterium]|nr:lipoyl(octanoyl) transferase LipB [Xanthomonadales bacterium]NIX11547.1 lipoyl(octanoyl) transferase LipB [Xanthomonadales bacterium]